MIIFKEITIIMNLKQEETNQDNEEITLNNIAFLVLIKSQYYLM